VGRHLLKKLTDTPKKIKVSSNITRRRVNNFRIHTFIPDKGRG